MRKSVSQNWCGESKKAGSQQIPEDLSFVERCIPSCYGHEWAHTAKLMPTSRFTRGKTSLDMIKATGPSPAEYACTAESQQGCPSLVTRSGQITKVKSKTKKTTRPSRVLSSEIRKQRPAASKVHAMLGNDRFRRNRRPCQRVSSSNPDLMN